MILHVALALAAVVGKPDAPKPKTMDKQYLTMMAVLAAAKTADAISTEHGLGCGGTETNPIFGPHPSAARLAVTNGLYFAGEVALAYGIKRIGRNHWWGRFWIVEPVYQTQQHVRLAVQNEGVRC